MTAEPGGRPAGNGLAGFELPRYRPAHLEHAEAERGVRLARLATEVSVRVRCTNGRPHTVRLRRGRLQLLYHSRADREGLYVSPLPRCLQVLAAWRSAGQPGHGHLVRLKSKPERWKIRDATLPPALRRAREQSIVDGRRRAERRAWLGMPALAADNAAGPLVARAARP